jgi:hypothetical protein
LVDQFEPFLPLIDHAIGQAASRVLAGEGVPASEKLLSLFGPLTRLFQRHKAAKPVEFGHTVMLDEVEGAIIGGASGGCRPCWPTFGAAARW